MSVATRSAAVSITVNPGMLERGLRAARSKLGAFARDARKMLAKVGGRVGRGVGRAVGRAFDPLGMGFDLVAGQVDEVMKFERSIARLAISQGKTNEAMSGFRNELTRVSKETGIGRNELLAGASAYQALTGDTKGATESISTFGRVAQATGSPVEEIATTAAALAQSLNIPTDKLEEAFGILNTQGKAGAIELKDMAAELSSLVPQFRQFAGSEGIGGMAEMGAVLQVVRRGFGTAGEAATGMRAAMTAIVRNADKLKKAGVRVFDKDPKTGKKHLREFSDIITSISRSKLMKDPTKLAKALGSDEALRAVLTLTRNMGDLKTLAETTDGGSIAKDLEQFLDSDAGKMEKAMNNLKLAIAEAFSPEVITKFAEGLGLVADALGFIGGAVKGTIEDWDELLHGVSYDKQVKAVRDARRGERIKQIEADPSLAHWGSEEKRRRAEEQLRKEDYMEDRIRALASGKAQMSATGGNVAAITSMLGDFKTDQKAVAQRIAGPALLKAVEADRAYEQQQRASATSDPDLVRARENTIKRLAGPGGAEYAQETGRDYSDLVRAAKSASPEVVSKYFADAMRNVLAAQAKQTTVVLQVDGQTVAQASADAQSHRRH